MPEGLLTSVKNHDETIGLVIFNKSVELGAKPATPVVVDIAVTNKPVIEILRSIGLQLGPRANIHVNSADKIVELSYSPVTGLGDVAQGY